QHIVRHSPLILTLLHSSFFLLISPHPPTSTLFPYTTLFRSEPAPNPIAVMPAASPRRSGNHLSALPTHAPYTPPAPMPPMMAPRSEEHTSELQSRGHLVCRLLLEKKKKKKKKNVHTQKQTAR